MKLEVMQMPRLAEVEKDSLSETYGMFVVQPLERGFGVTMGHALRRVLLSAIQGAAIKQVSALGKDLGIAKTTAKTPARQST